MGLVAVGVSLTVADHYECISNTYKKIASY